MIEDVQRVVRFGVEVVGLPGQPVAQRDGQRVGVVVPEERYSDAVLTLCQFACMPLALPSGVESGIRPARLFG